MSPFESELYFGGMSFEDEFAGPSSEYLDWETGDHTPKNNEISHNRMDAFEHLMNEDVAFWSELSHPADRLLHVDKPDESYMDVDSDSGSGSDSTNKNISEADNDTNEDTIKATNKIERLSERFPLRPVEEPLVSFSTELSQLHQTAGESLRTYYNRLRTMMRRVGARDHPPEEQKSSEQKQMEQDYQQQQQQFVHNTVALNQCETLLLEDIMHAFVNGLSDPVIRDEASNLLLLLLLLLPLQTSSPQRRPTMTLAALYIAAEGARMRNNNRRLLPLLLSNNQPPPAAAAAVAKDEYDYFGDDREVMLGVQKYIYGRMPDSEIEAFRTLLAQKCGVVDFAWME